MMLVFAMSIGAGVLFLLDGTVPWSGGPALTAVSGARPGPVESIEIQYVRPAELAQAGSFDYVVYPASYPQRVRSAEEIGSRIRVAVVGSGSSQLDAGQQGALLNVIGSLRRARGFSLSKIVLAPDSDARRVPALPEDAHHLCSLLVGRGIVR